MIDTIQELNQLTQTLYSELNLFQRLFLEFDPILLLDVQPRIAPLMQETIIGSLQKYDELQRLQATNRTNTLQQAVDQIKALSSQPCSRA